MKSSAAAPRYAQALFALAREENRVEAVRGELAALGRAMAEHRELREAILRPLYPAAERRAALTQVCAKLGASTLVQNFCSFLVDQRRIIDFGAIQARYGELADRAAGRCAARIVAARPLSDEQKRRLERALSARTGQQVQIEVQIEAGLLGGAVAQVGDLVFDGSLQAQLEMLRTNLTRGH